MNRILLMFSRHSRWTGFHVAMFGALLTGAFMAVSAEDLGPMGPMIVSLSICVMFFAICCEFCLFLRVVVGWLARKIIQKGEGVQTGQLADEKSK